MIHEVLLALSGHPSPLFRGEKPDENFPYVSAPEKALLEPVGKLARLYADTKSHLYHIIESHPSPVCRAVAQSLLIDHLSAFQQCVLDVESEILSRNPLIVGAYDAVPLAAVVSRFNGWTRRLQWFSELSTFISSSEASSDALSQANGAQLLDRLLRETKTGYEDISVAAASLLTVGEHAWLRQVSSWLLGCDQSNLLDFFIKYSDSQSSSRYSVESTSFPNFLDSGTATSLLFIGNILRSLESKQNATQEHRSLDIPRLANSRIDQSDSPARAPSVADRMDIIRPLSTIASPLTKSRVSAAVSEIKSTLARKLVNGPLPIRRLASMLSSIHEFFLCERASLVHALVAEADRQTNTRHRNVVDLAGIVMKDAEVASVLAKSWANLASPTGQGELVDARLEWARESLCLRIPSTNIGKDHPNQARLFHGQEADFNHFGALFADFLLPVPSELTVPIRPPLDLFLSSQDVKAYSAIHSYLISISRAHLHLSDLWRSSRIRRRHPAPIGPPRSNRERVRPSIQKSRKRVIDRENRMRGIWSSCMSFIHFLNELESYLFGEIIINSRSQFDLWLRGNPQNLNERAASPLARHRSKISEDSLSSSTSQLQIDPGMPLDPEVLTRAHKTFLITLVQSLLLANEPYAYALRSLLKQADQIAAQIVRLTSVQTSIDLADEGVVETSAGAQNFAQQEREIYEDLQGTCARITSDMAKVLACLRDIDLESSASGRVAGRLVDKEGEFEPYAGGGVDRLLVRLDFEALRGSSMSTAEAVKS